VPPTILLDGKLPPIRSRPAAPKFFRSDFSPSKTWSAVDKLTYIDRQQVLRSPFLVDNSHIAGNIGWTIPGTLAAIASMIAGRACIAGKPPESKAVHPQWQENSSRSTEQCTRLRSLCFAYRQGARVRPVATISMRAVARRSQTDRWPTSGRFTPWGHRRPRTPMRWAIRRSEARTAPCFARVTVIQLHVGASMHGLLEFSDWQPTADIKVLTPVALVQSFVPGPGRPINRALPNRLQG